MARENPERFQGAVKIEEHLTAKVGQPVYLTRTGRPLAVVASQIQGSLLDPDGPETCDEGSCFT